MAQLDILVFPDSRLRQRAQEVATVDAAIRQLVDDMFETMYAADGIGLAATQVNDHRRVVVMDVADPETEERSGQGRRPMVFINPEIIDSDGRVDSEEGCLSIPGFYESVPRAQRIKVKALDRDGKLFELDAEGLLAVCIQHEIDHLDGRLFVDYLSTLKRDRIRKKLEKKSRQDQGVQPRGQREVV
ncbi:peptide deformylase [Ectothiorhodosinus mongolicus]|uniref:Peptide deformylase n=1 Tax=Ectothiorhodosinus mongolicus TaxID=233100 RepID=A0A1R3VXI3_9GAMM|nr:peptide deformylase [Ectothiorhodosinus mongolicus]ULX57067.1 peptide deformylase [Ectothiorhodosinus mongolicus]SIT69750.1 peptide deformylase [Ectothiorhodosinus mongolicus]